MIVVCNMHRCRLLYKTILGLANFFSYIHNHRRNLRGYDEVVMPHFVVGCRPLYFLKAPYRSFPPAQSEQILPGQEFSVMKRFLKFSISCSHCLTLLILQIKTINSCKKYEKATDDVI